MHKKVSNVLLVDDDLAINFLHKRIITKSELAEPIISLYNGAEAIRHLKFINNSLSENDLVFIFLDLNMPIMDGWEFLEHYENIYKDLNYQCRIFVLSASINPDDIQKAKNNHYVSEYFSKPLNMDSIETLKEKYL
jgi:response regulator of citrate/malate metabolism